MTRFDPAAPLSRTIRLISGAGAVLVLTVAASGCIGGSPAPAPTPDPFAGLADRSDQAFREGLELYGQGQYRDAQAAFDRARLLSPNADPKIDAMLQRTRDALAPTATPVPPTPTSAPVPPTPTPVAMSTQTPDTELGRRYFGQVALAVVPTRDMAAPPATEFFYEDQIGLRIEGLKQHLRLPFSVRVFDVDRNVMVAEIGSADEAPPSSSTRGAKSPAGSSSSTLTSAAAAAPAASSSAASSGGASSAASGGAAWLKAQAAHLGLSAGGDANASPDPTVVAAATAVAQTTGPLKLTHFFDSYVWYHTGGELPGHYRLELYASGVLTDTLDYTVRTTPVPTPEPTLAPTLEPTPVPAPAVSEPAPPPPVVQPTLAVRTPAPAPVERPAPPVVAPPPPTPTPEPTLPPTPTPQPTPASVGAAVIGAAAAGLDVNANDDHLFIADGAGRLWSADLSTSSSFNQPIDLGTPPSDVVVDQASGNVFVAARRDSAVLVLDSTGKRLTSIALPSTPGDLQIDSQLGLVFVALPERQAIGVIDARAGRLVRTIDGLPQVTGLALDTGRHVLYVSHLAGQVSVIDTRGGGIADQIAVTGPGLQGVATARGLVYAINPTTHELAVVEPRSEGVIRYPLSIEPIAIGAADDSGSVYVLASQPSQVVRFDPTSGDEIGRVLLALAPGQPVAAIPPRPRVAVDAAHERVLVALPDTGAFSLIPTEAFPSLDHDIPWAQLPDEPLYAGGRP